MFDYLVVGKGLFGSAAIRHLSLMSDNVAIIGPDEPADPDAHTGVFASHVNADHGNATIAIALRNRRQRGPALQGFAGMKKLRGSFECGHLSSPLERPTPAGHRA